ncbi:MAG: hypothetical protein MJB12_07695 [Firmicutes bacterium]|nr:hypothetical protein [Bacillota bacterium]
MGFFDFLLGRNNHKSGREDFQAEVKNVDSSKLTPFDEEVSTDIMSADVTQSYNSYSDNGLELQEVQDKVRIVYSGLLAKNGAQDIYVIVGYGNNLRWEDVAYYPLHKIDAETYELVLPVKRDGNINIAFKDAANNWDNNGEMNYTFENHFFEGSS